MQFHKNIPDALKHPSVWAGIGVACTSVAQSVVGHAQTTLLSIAGAAGIIAAWLKAPSDDTKVDKDDAQ